jgi:thioredoxin reductase (NADPH)
MRNLKDGSQFAKSVDGVFVAIGHRPATTMFEGSINLDKNGYIVVGASGEATAAGATSVAEDAVASATTATATSVPGVFAAGDVCDPVYRQTVTSAAQGCMAAMNADHFLATTPN